MRMVGFSYIFFLPIIYGCVYCIVFFHGHCCGHSKNESQNEITQFLFA